MYKDKYQDIIIKINNVEESHIVQKLLFSLEVTWGGEKYLYFDDGGYYVISINKIRNSISNYNDSDLNWILRNRKTDNKIYYSKDLNKIKNILLFGDDIPSYKPKRIERKV